MTNVFQQNYSDNLASFEDTFEQESLNEIQQFLNTRKPDSKHVFDLTDKKIWAIVYAEQPKQDDPNVEVRRITRVELGTGDKFNDSDEIKFIAPNNTVYTINDLEALSINRIFYYVTMDV